MSRRTRALPARIRRLARRVPPALRAPLRPLAEMLGYVPWPPRRLPPSQPHCDLAVGRPKRDGDRIRYSATLHLPSGERRLLWFRVSQRHADAVTDRADPFVLPGLQFAMLAGRPLRVRGAPVSPSLLRNLEEFQRAWASWRPKVLTAVPLLADDEVEAPQAAQVAVCTFSGGVDSCYTVYRHLVAPQGPRERELRGALILHGFDIRRENSDTFALACARSERILAGLDLELIPVQGNLGVGLPRSHWSDGHGIYLASALTLLGGRFGAGLIASTGTYRQLVVPWGSNPVTDPLMGSRSFEIVHYGTAVSYIDKLRAIARWPAALDNIRFCFGRSREARNCGRCRKCVQVGLIFRAAGVPAPLDRPLDDAHVTRVILDIRDDPNEFSQWTMEMILSGADERGIDEPWVDLIRRELPRFRAPGSPYLGLRASLDD